MVELPVAQLAEHGEAQMRGEYHDRHEEQGRGPGLGHGHARLQQRKREKLHRENVGLEHRALPFLGPAFHAAPHSDECARKGSQPAGHASQRPDQGIGERIPLHHDLRPA
jgi:hypothetical protein